MSSGGVMIYNREVYADDSSHGQDNCQGIVGDSKWNYLVNCQLFSTPDHHMMQSPSDIYETLKFIIYYL